MRALSAAFDNIRLIRRKIQIAQQNVAVLDGGAQRDAAVIHLASLVEDVVRALQDFADMGYEDEVADMICAGDNLQAGQQVH